MNWLNIIISILSGLVALIPLVAKLIEYVKLATKEKNWGKLIELVTNLMIEAENKFDDGATRKEWVLAMVKASATTINYEVDIETVSQLIDELCAMSKQVNVAKK